MDRGKCVELIGKKLSVYNDCVQTVNNLSKELERGVWDISDSSETYRRQCRTIISNLSVTLNAPMVRKRLFEGTWNAYDVGKMTAEQLFPERREQELLESQKEKEINDAFRDMKLSRNSIYTCGRCKKNKVEYHQSQRASADEGMHITCVCTTCGHRWRFS